MFNLLQTNDAHYLFSICWCIAWAGDANIFPDSQRKRYIISIAKIWVDANASELRRMAAWALSKIIVPVITKEDITEIKDLSIRVQEYYNNPENEFDKETAVLFGTILGKTFDKKELEGKIKIC
jgi:hypothetical protein